MKTKRINKWVICHYVQGYYPGTGWEDFFAKRDKLWDGYWTAVRAGETPPVPADAIQTQLDDGYRTMIDAELRSQRAIDSQMARMLPEEQRQIVTLKYREKLTCAEVAQRLKLKTNTVAKALSRGYERLERILVRGEG